MKKISIKTTDGNRFDFTSDKIDIEEIILMSRNIGAIKLKSNCDTSVRYFNWANVVCITEKDCE